MFPSLVRERNDAFQAHFVCASLSIFATETLGSDLMLFRVLFAVGMIWTLYSLRIPSFCAGRLRYSSVRSIATPEMNRPILSQNLKETSSLTSKVPFREWTTAARQHAAVMDSLLYPVYVRKTKKTSKLWSEMTPERLHKLRTHQVSNHPIYNFLHNYYQYSALQLCKYSPGLDVSMEGIVPGQPWDEMLDNRFITHVNDCGIYRLDKFIKQLKEVEKWRIIRSREVLKATAKKPAFYGCFGLHEWAMLYSGNGTKTGGHQQIPLRVSQETIDSVVGAPGQLRCTHFDAFRFFQPAARPLNVISPLERETQARFEQPGCIHANMDLFRYAYTIYPMIPSELLVATLEVAIAARKVDMRASPYDVSQYEGCEVPLCVETAQGRRMYVEEQERIAERAAPLRRQLCDAYDVVVAAMQTQ